MSHRVLGLNLVLTALLLGGSAPSLAAETFESLSLRVPGEANALVLIDVEQMLAAPLAREQGWSKKLEAAFVERPIFLPPEAKKLVLAAALQPQREFLGAWELAVMELAEPVTARAIARGSSGYVEQVQGVDAAFSPNDAAFVELAGGVLAALRPADRQFLSRWIAFAGNNADSELSDYLEAALPKVTDRVQMLLAIDLTDVLGPHDIEAKIADSSSWLEPGTSNLQAIAAVLETLRGASLRIAVGNDCQGQLQIDFGADVAPLGDLAKPLVLHALTNLGFPTDELSKWEVSLAPRSIRMQGTLTPEMQRRVFSVIELPAADLSGDDPTADAAGEPSESNIRERSLTYFAATQVRVTDIRNNLKDLKPASVSLLERSARAIDELPVLHVDDELLDYGDKLAETLRVMSLSKSQAGIRGRVRRAESAGTGYYDYGYGYGPTAGDERAAITQQELGTAQDTRVQGLKLIDDATADIRRKMTQKYGVEF
jgi:hypothetical protein